jgi:hypothetical protein
VKAICNKEIFFLPLSFGYMIFFSNDIPLRKKKKGPPFATWLGNGWRGREMGLGFTCQVTHGR